MQKYLRVYSGCVNQLPLSWKTNLQNTLNSIQFAVDNKCHFRPGIEFELCGTSCGVHFHDSDFNDSAWNSIAAILKSDLTQNLIVEVGTVLLHEKLLYNCLVTIYKSKIHFVRPATHIRTDSSHPSNRFISEWTHRVQTEYIEPPSSFRALYPEMLIPIGNYFQEWNDISIVSLFESEAKTDMFKRALCGHHNLISISSSRVFEYGQNVKILQNFSQKLENQWAVVNSLAGVETPKTIFEGGAYILGENKIYQTIEGLSLKSNQNSFFDIPIVQNDKSNKKTISKLWKKHSISDLNDKLFENTELSISTIKELILKPFEEETLNAISSFLYHMLENSHACGFFLPLSGGADSSLTLMCVYHLCDKIFAQGDHQIYRFKELIQKPSLEVQSAKDLMREVLFPAYFPMNFSGRTENFADELAETANCRLLKVNINEIYEKIKTIFEKSLDISTDFTYQNDKPTGENIALQSLQARIRLVCTYFSSQLLPRKYNLSSFLLNFATGNLSEVVRGYYSQYDNSSGDINIIGSLTKTDVWSILQFLEQKYPDFTVLKKIIEQAPTAELCPPVENQTLQTDERDMGLNYSELDFLTRVMKEEFLGPEDLLKKYELNYQTGKGVEVINCFLKNFHQNRHKASKLPPSLHLTKYDLDNQFDLRPIIYREDNLLKKRETI